MGTLSSELATHAERLSPRPRIYADANVPAGLVSHMRARLDWDVLLVINAPDERLLAALLDRIDRALFRQSDEGCDGRPIGLPLAGRKMHAHTDWGRVEPTAEAENRVIQPSE
jgi:hypothetical protein